MATKLKTAPRHLSLVPPLPPVSHRLVSAATPWWTHPAWCSQGDDCYGGETLDFGRGTARRVSRHHFGVMFDAQIQDIEGDTVKVRIEVEAVEVPDEGFVDGPFVNIDMPHGLITDADSAERIANAMAAAVAAARQPLTSTQTPAETPVAVTA